MPWTDLGDIAAAVGIDRAEGAAYPLVDPYWLWADTSGWREFVLDMPAFGADRVSFIGQLAPRRTVAQLQAEAAAVCAIEIPPIYAQAGLPESGSPYFTGRVQRDALPKLARLPSLVRWELGAPVRPADVQDAIAPVPQAVPARVQAAARQAGATVLLGVIDDGVAFLHRAFRDGAGGTRLRLLWDQGVKASGRHWQVPERFGYGRQARPQALAAALADRALLPAVDEAEVYRDWDYLLGPRTLVPPRPVWRATHGTHVLDVAGGRRDPLAGTAGAADGASDSELAFVGLPATTVSDSSGGSLPVHVLDALRAIFAECAPDAAAVVSLSYGCQGGPHDGSSLLERAMDDLLLRRRVGKRKLSRSAIVISAGNSALTRCHAAQRVTPDDPAEWSWEVPADDNTDSFLEIWYPPAEGVALTVEVQSPAGDRSGPLAPGQAATLPGPDARPLALLVHQARVPTGEQSMALLALAPTAPRDGGAGAAPGVWTVRVAATGGAAEVHAYIERDDPVPKSNKPQSGFVAGSERTGTINGIATGRHVLVAGGAVRSTRRGAVYSSRGPARDARAAGPPHVLATCEISASQPGVRAAAVRSADTLLMNGTSVAAPMVARRLLNLLAADAGLGIDLDDLPATVTRLLGAGRDAPGDPDPAGPPVLA